MHVVLEVFIGNRPISSYSLDKTSTEVTVGRGPENGICLDDEKLSRQHAILGIREQHFYVSDLSSVNGTSVIRCEQGAYSHHLTLRQQDGALELFHGDLVRVGDHYLRCLVTPSAPAPSQEAGLSFFRRTAPVPEADVSGFDPFATEDCDMTEVVRGALIERGGLRPQHDESGSTTMRPAGIPPHAAQPSSGGSHQAAYPQAPVSPGPAWTAPTPPVGSDAHRVPGSDGHRARATESHRIPSASGYQSQGSGYPRPPSLAPGTDGYPIPGSDAHPAQPAASQSPEKVAGRFRPDDLFKLSEEVPVPDLESTLQLPQSWQPAVPGAPAGHDPQRPRTPMPYQGHIATTPSLPGQPAAAVTTSPWVPASSEPTRPPQQLVPPPAPQWQPAQPVPPTHKGTELVSPPMMHKGTELVASPPMHKGTELVSAPPHAQVPKATELVAAPYVPPTEIVGHGAAPPSSHDSGSEPPSSEDIGALVSRDGIEIPTHPPLPRKKKKKKRPEMPARLLLLDEGQPRAMALDTETITVGRDKDQTLCLMDRSVSGRHAEVYRVDEKFFVRDLGSKNKTRVDGRHIAPMEDVPIYNNTVIAFGSVYAVLICSRYQKGVVKNWDVGRNPTLLHRLEKLGAVTSDQADVVMREMKRTHSKLIETLVLKGILHPKKWLRYKRKLQEFGLSPEAGGRSSRRATMRGSQRPFLIWGLCALLIALGIAILIVLSGV